MSRRTNRLAGQLSAFVQQYRRKSQRNTEPNDRKYSREAEAEMKRLQPELLSELISGETNDVLPTKVVKKKSLDPFAKYRKRGV